MWLIINIFLFLINNTFAHSGIFASESEFQFVRSNDNGSALFLTHYIRNGNIEVAREASRVGILEGVPYIPSYSGFLTVNQYYNSNIFFWFFPATNTEMKAPILLWLQGGPGSSGFVGIFLEHGPYVVYANNSIGLSELSWNQNFHMIYVDNPVGCGYSFTDNEEGYATNEEEVTDNLYEFLQQFFSIFYEYRNNDFYITGESYGGKYVPSLAYRIHTNGPSSNINLKGITIGNGFSHPPVLVDNAAYYYHIGVLDQEQARLLKASTECILEPNQHKKLENACNIFKQNIPNPVTSTESFLEKSSGYTFLYNLLYTEWPEEYDYFIKYVQLPEFRKATHVGNLLYEKGDELVQHYLQKDFTKSVQDKVVVLINNYKVLFYNGQLDLAVPYTPTAKWLRNLQWKYAEEFRETERRQWKINGNKIAGYIHNVGDFYHALVLGAGHLVPHDKPREAFDLISRFIYNTL